jgi:hypothetical protein
LIFVESGSDEKAPVGIDWGFFVVTRGYRPTGEKTTGTATLADEILDKLTIEWPPRNLPTVNFPPNVLTYLAKDQSKYYSEPQS